MHSPKWQLGFKGDPGPQSFVVITIPWCPLMATASSRLPFVSQIFFYGVPFQIGWLISLGTVILMNYLRLMPYILWLVVLVDQ